MRRYLIDRRGFSLLELLVACSILVIVCLVLAQSLHLSENIWTGGRSRSETRGVVRAAQDFIATELQAAALPVDGEILIGRGNLQMVINPPSVPDDFRNADAIFWQAPIATELSDGVFAELGYFVRWENNRAALCRLFLNPSKSRTLLESNNSFQRVYQYPGNWVNAAVLEAAAPADKDRGYLGLFAENVIGFWARPLNREGKVVYNAGAVGFDSNQDFDGLAAPVLPAFVEISFVVISPRAANLLAERNDAGALVARIQFLAREARAASNQSPAAEFVSKLRNEPALRFLHQGTDAYRMLVDLH